MSDSRKKIHENVTAKTSQQPKTLTPPPIAQA